MNSESGPQRFGLSTDSNTLNRSVLEWESQCPKRPSVSRSKSGTSKSVLGSGKLRSTNSSSSTDLISPSKSFLTLPEESGFPFSLESPIDSHDHPNEFRTTHRTIALNAI